MQAILFDLVPSPPSTTWFQQVLTSLHVGSETPWPDLFGFAIRQWLFEHNHRPIKTLSLFSGGGGLDIAFHDTGFEVVEMVEIEAKYTETLKLNTQPGKLLAQSAVVCTDIRNYHPHPDLSVDFIIGGPPCQTFSAAGRRAAGVLGTSDPRGILFEEYVRLLKTLRPKGFLFENVYGITGAQNGEAWRDIQSAFKAAGYTIYSRVLDAADYGVPQHRERLFIVGVLEGEFLFPYPTHGPDSPGEQPFYTAGEAVAGLHIFDQNIGIGGRFGNLLQDIPPGLNYSFYTKEMGHPSPVFSWRSKFSDFLYKADPHVPVRTIKAQGGQYTGPFSWENRPFTVTELKRLQTFPDTYELVGGRQVCIEQIGNSVPPQIGRILALSILHQIMNVELPFPMHYLPQNRQLGFRQRKRRLTEIYAAKAKQAIQNLYSIGEVPRAKAFPAQQEYVRYLTDDFAWTKTETVGSTQLMLQVEITPIEWEISGSLGDAHGNNEKYKIIVEPSSTADWPLEKRQIVLQAKSWDIHVFTGLWKAFEELLAEFNSIADLVQLCGYYQYTPKIKAHLEVSEGLETTLLWRIIQYVVEGVGVGTQLSTSQLAMLWQIDDTEVLPLVKLLRQVGYEVRNYHTNPQIIEGDYLIPYAFPTLTPRSVQLRKRLEPTHA